MESLLQTQNEIMEAMEKVYINYKKDGPDRRTVHSIKRRVNTLDGYWQEFQTIHRKLCEFEHEGHDYFTKNYFERTKDFYYSKREYFMEQLVLAEEGNTAAPALLTSMESNRESQGEPKPQQHSAGQQRGTTPPPSTSAVEQQEPTPGTSQERIKIINFPLSTKSKNNDIIWEEKMRKQQSNFKAFARTIDSIDLQSLHEKWELDDILRSVQTRWAAIDSLHWEIDSLACEGDDIYEITFNHNEQKYLRIKKEINSKIWSVTHREKSIPQMDIPTFNGNFRQWISFKDLFTEAIHNNRSMSNAQKMQFLKSKVKGEAERLVQHLSISSENYEVCWEILNHRFNNMKLIFSTHISNILSIATMQQPSYIHIKRLHDTTNESLNAIKNLGIDITTWDPLIVHLLSQKLDSGTHEEYMESLKNPRDLPTLKDFLNFLEFKFTSQESGRRKQDSTKSNFQQDNSKKVIQKTNQTSHKQFANHTSANTSTGTVKKWWKCPICSKRHKIFHCKEFLDQKPDNKRKTVLKLDLCENCLYDHNGKECKSEKRCSQCDGNHNTLLHEAYGDGSNFNKGSDRTGYEKTTATKQMNVSHASQEYLNEVLLATAQLKVRSAGGTYLTMRALIDQGSQVSLITENAAQRLGLTRQRCKGTVFGIGTKENNCKGVLNITASAIHSDFTFSTELIIMKNLINNLPNRSFNRPSWSYLDGIQLADPEFNVSRPVDILLGADVYSDIILSGVIKENGNQPIAQQSRLGWILCGKVKSYQCNVVIHNLDDIKNFWAIEDMADSTIDISSEDYYCVNQYEKETRRQEDGRYIVRLPLQTEIKDKLGESKHKAVAQFHQLERKFVKRNDISNNYKSFINEYMQLGHMQPANERNKTPGYFMPHHCVQRADSTTTALRVVFNASAKTTSGYSLNDLMFSGPNLQADLLSLIMKWRQYKVAFTADIEKMFRQIMCHQDDQIYQKIIWRNSVNEHLREYVLTTITYGTKAAPFLAMKTLKQLASDEGHKYPEAAKVLEQDFYMDDLLSGTHNIAQAKKIQTDLINLLKAGGFNLRKWCSNSYELLEEVSIEGSHTQAFDFKNLESTKTLGLRWNPHDDIFSFQLKINTSTTKPATKRSLLSDISKIFDPLGWLSPVTTNLKLLFQAIWLMDLQWDDQLPEIIDCEWSKIKQDIVHIDKIKIPRWLKCHEQDDIELHGFCDSSENAYACVVYSKVYSRDQDGNTKPIVIIIAAKSRLVPSKKSVSLPRLELCAALLLSRLMQAAQQSLAGHRLKIYGWSDSTAVLGWLQGNISRWKPFVSNRVQKITAVMRPDCWRYVRSAENPADCASRGITTSQLLKHTLWWQGPTWLLTFKPEKDARKYETKEELKISKQTNVSIQRHKYDVIGDLISRYSSLTRVTHVIAWVLRAVSLKKPRLPFLTVNEIRRANELAVKHLQQESFGEEISSLKQDEKIKADSKLLPLNPFLDKNGLLRVGGRIKNANIDEDMKHPFILPHSGHLINLLIDHAHKMTFHGGARVTLAWLRKRYWIMGGNRAVKARVHQCVKCKKHKPMKQNQLMGDLPAARCNPTRPFYHTGVDYTGFIDVKSSKGRGIKSNKGYVAVFVCMVTKAVHLELVSDLSSSAFLAALRRLAARRGTPHHMYSDNGTNFVGANKTLKQEFINLKNTLDNEFFSIISDMEITWHFNAPSWPSAGGLWEAAVKSLKHHLRRVIGEQKLTYEEISTVLSQLEACLNARPLCALSEDPDDIDYLTPSHFLASGPTLTIIETETDQRTRWMLVQKIFADTWKRWQSEYLCQLSSRSKWLSKRDNMQVGDVVIINVANLPPGKWALGKIIELHPGKDGCVRVVSVKTKNGILKRPIIKLSILLQNSTSDNVHIDKQDTNNIQKQSSGSNGTIRGKGLCNSIILTLLLILSVMSPARCAYNLMNLNNNQSIYLDKIANMQLIREDWNLIVYYDMEPYWQGLKMFSEYLINLETLCSKAKQRTQCDVVLLQLRHDVEELEHYNKVLLGQQLTRSSRQRRGLINGIGNIANTLFGVLDSNFAEQYQKDINLIRANQKHLALLWKNQTSVVEAEYNLLKRVEQTMEKQQKMLNQFINKMERSNNALTNKVIDVENSIEFTLSTMVATNIIMNLKNIQETLLETVTDIHHGMFNVHLLTPEQLQGELSIISGQLSKDLTIPVENIQTNLQDIYHLLKVRARVTNQYFIFEIKIPLVSRDNLEVYKLVAVPQQREELMVRMIPISDHIAINLQKDSYMPVTENELQDCMRYNLNTYICHIQRPIYRMQTDDSLCVKKQQAGQCETETMICKNTWTELHKLNTYLFFCCNHCRVNIICEQQVTAIQASRAGVITLGQGCIIKSDTFTIIAHKQQSNYLNISSNLVKVELPPINNMINLSIPLNKVEDTLNDSLTDQRRYLQDIGRQVEQIKANEVNGVLADNLSSHDVHQFVVLYILMGAFIMMFAYLVWRRLQRRYGIRLQSPPAAERPIPLSTQYAIPNVRVQRSQTAPPPPRSSLNETSHSTLAANAPSARVLNRATTSFITNKRYI